MPVSSSLPSGPPVPGSSSDPSHETRMSAAFIDLADTLVSDFDPADYLCRVTEHCMNLLERRRRALRP